MGVGTHKGRESGAWFELKCVRETITAKEAKGQDASFERSLLKSWAEYPGWKNAGKALPQA